MQLEGRVALVTGAGRRVGRVIALRLAEARMRLALHYRNSEDEARELMERIVESGGDADIFQAELADRAAVERLVPAVAQRFGGLDVLVNNASVFRDVWLSETTDEEWDENFAVNVTAPFILSRAFARHLDGRPGKIINLNDWKTTRPKRFAYGVSKAALTGLTRSLAAALAPAVQVNEVALGSILVPIGAPDEYAEVLSTKSPAQRMGTPEEVAHGIVSLLENDYITGETLYIDGGQRLSRT